MVFTYSKDQGKIIVNRGNNVLTQEYTRITENQIML